MQIAHPGDILCIPAKAPCSFVGAFEPTGERAERGAVRAVKLPLSIEDVIDAVVEVARMPVGVEEVNRIAAIRRILHVRAMPEREGDVDRHVAALSRRAAFVGRRKRRLEAGVESAKEVVEPTAALVFGGQEAKVGIRKGRLLAGNDLELGEPIRAVGGAREAP